jgi:predicted AAA+ superfamily ATPase
MIDRPFWQNRIHDAWKKAPIVWFSGVRRAGKTVLAQGLGDATYLNCDLPSSARSLADPEMFFSTLATPYVVLDEVHQLPDPSRVLKIAADAFPSLRVLATGSSTLAATRKFRDSLTGRKREVRLTPVLCTETGAFGVRDVRDRIVRGGLPQALLSAEPDPGFYNEWLDSYFARDVQELFRVEKRREFLLLVELLLRKSGGLFEASKAARDAGLSRPTVLSYLEVLELTHVAHIIRPWSGGGTRELLRQPKVYGFDTGFVRHEQGWTELRDTDLGLLWEHLVLDELHAQFPDREVRFWRDKSFREIDFILPAGRGTCDAIECKWNPDHFSPDHLHEFRRLYPKGRNLVASPGIGHAYRRHFGGMDVLFASPANWVL